MGTKAQSLGSHENRARDYSLELVGKTVDVLETLRCQGELRLTDIVDATRLDKSTTFRILHTLEQRGYVVRDLRTKRFRLPRGHRRFRVGYAQPKAGHRFGDIVTESLVKEAQRRGIELLVVDNRWDSQEAVKNAYRLAQQKVDFAIEFQVHYEAAPVIAEIFAEANIRTMALGVPQPGAIYLGANNYAAGLLCGEQLARHAMDHWRGRLDRVIFLEYPGAGRQVHSRLIGALKGIQRVLPGFGERQVTYVKTMRVGEDAHQAMRKALRSTTGSDRIGITSINDDGAWAALRAVREAGRERLTSVMGMSFDASPAFVKEMRKPGSSLIGSVAWFPEKYGPEALSVVTRCLNGEAVPPAIYTEHALVTRENLDTILVAAKSSIVAPGTALVGDTADVE